MFPMTVTIHNPAQLNAVLAAMGSDLPESVTRPVTTPEQTLVDKAEAKVTVKKDVPADPKPTPAKTDKPAASQPTAEADKADAPESKPETSAALDYTNDVKPVVINAIKKGKRTEVTKLLADMGTDHAEKLKPEQWPAFIAKVNELVGA